MTHDNADLPGRIVAAFDELAAAAERLNAVSDELSRSVTSLDAALKKLNLGVSTWVRLSRTEDPSGTFALKELGYAKVGGKWGLALRTINGYGHQMEREQREEWLYNEAPRSLRVQAIDMIPELLETLVRDARNTARSISRKIKHVDKLDLPADTPRTSTPPQRYRP